MKSLEFLVVFGFIGGAICHIYGWDHVAWGLYAFAFGVLYGSWERQE